MCHSICSCACPNCVANQRYINAAPASVLIIYKSPFLYRRDYTSIFLNILWKHCKHVECHKWMNLEYAYGYIFFFHIIIWAASCFINWGLKTSTSPSSTLKSRSGDHSATHPTSSGERSKFWWTYPCCYFSLPSHCHSMPYWRLATLVQWLVNFILPGNGDGHSLFWRKLPLVILRWGALLRETCPLIQTCLHLYFQYRKSPVLRDGRVFSVPSKRCHHQWPNSVSIREVCYMEKEVFLSVSLGDLTLYHILEIAKSSVSPWECL